MCSRGERGVSSAWFYHDSRGDARIVLPTYLYERDLRACEGDEATAGPRRGAPQRRGAESGAKTESVRSGSWVQEGLVKASDEDSLLM